MSLFLLVSKISERSIALLSTCLFTFDVIYSGGATTMCKRLISAMLSAKGSVASLSFLIDQSPHGLEST